MAAIAGILIGLLAALLQSVSYIFTGKYMRECGRGTISLLSPSFALMSVVSLPVLPFLLPDEMPALGEYLFPVFFCVGFCMVGHGALFFMQKSVDASRASPLLSMKVPIVALTGCIFMGDRYSVVQWAGVLLVVVSAWLLCNAGRRIPLKALAWLLVACMGYAASDYCILMALNAFKPVCSSFLHYTLLTMFAVYAAGGVYGFIGMLLIPRTERRVWKTYVIPFSFFWLLAMISLFMCFALIGIVQGNIVQSARGLISVVIGWFLARAGFVHLEEKVSRAVFIRRLASAVLIILAIGLFKLGK